MGIYEHVLESKSKGHELNKNGLPCLLDILPGIVCHILVISVRFQWVLGSLKIFLSLYGILLCIYFPKISVAIVFLEINCNVKHVVGIKTKNCGPRTGYFNICIERLRAEFGESKEDKCRRLAAELSAIQQERGESVEQFAFKYKKLLHQLEKLGEKIAKDCPTFAISQFISKVNSRIAQQLVVKAAEFETLDKTVEAARRIELSFQKLPTASNDANQSLDEWKVTPPNAFVSWTAMKSPDQQFQRQQRVCYTCVDLWRNKSFVTVLSEKPQRSLKKTRGLQQLQSISEI